MKELINIEKEMTHLFEHARILKQTSKQINNTPIKLLKHLCLKYSRIHAFTH
jgi:hypothetical protein